MTTRLDVATTIFSALLSRSDAYQLSRLFEDSAALERMAAQAAQAADAVVAAVEHLPPPVPGGRRPLRSTSRAAARN